MEESAQAIVFPIDTQQLATDPFFWVASATGDRTGTRNYLAHVYATGSEIVGTDGHRMHIAASDLEPGFYAPVSREYVCGPDEMWFPAYRRYIQPPYSHDLIANMTRKVLGRMPAVLSSEPESNMIELVLPKQVTGASINLCEDYLTEAMAPANEINDTIGIFQDPYRLSPQQARLDMSAFGGATAVIMGCAQGPTV